MEIAMTLKKIAIILFSYSLYGAEEAGPAPVEPCYKEDFSYFSLKNSIVLSAALLQRTAKEHGYLMHVPVFNRENLRDKQQMTAFFQRQPGYSFHTAQTRDGITISYDFFDRHANRLILVAPGFTNSSKVMASFVEMFPHDDIAIINFRGHGKTKSSSPIFKVLGVEGSVRLGAHEEKDIEAALASIEKLKKHTEKVGLGICYGAFVLAKAQALNEKDGKVLFHKLILDGFWTSLSNFSDKIFKNPALIFNPQSGDAPRWLRSFVNTRLMRGFIQRSLEKGIGSSFNDIDLSSILAHITIPVCCWYGKDDLTISRADFEHAFDALSSKRKAAIITSNPHVRNHLQSPALYAWVCKTFMHYRFSTFEEIMTSAPQVEHMCMAHVQPTRASAALSMMPTLEDCSEFKKNCCTA